MANFLKDETPRKGLNNFKPGKIVDIKEAEVTKAFNDSGDYLLCAKIPKKWLKK